MRAERTQQPEGDLRPCGSRLGVVCESWNLGVVAPGVNSEKVKKSSLAATGPVTHLGGIVTTSFSTTPVDAPPTARLLPGGALLPARRLAVLPDRDRLGGRGRREATDSDATP